MPTIHHLIVFVMAAIQFPQECAHACLRARVQLGLRRIFFLLLLDLHFEFRLVSLQFFCLEPIHPGPSTQEDRDLPLLHFLSLRPRVLQISGLWSILRCLELCSENCSCHAHLEQVPIPRTVIMEQKDSQTRFSYQLLRPSSICWNVHCEVSHKMLISTSVQIWRTTHSLSVYIPLS